MQFIVVIVIIILIVAWALVTYNKCMRYKTILNDTWQSITQHLKRRYGLIPVYIELSKMHLQDTTLFTELAEARSAAMEAETVTEKAATEAELYRILTTLNARVQSYETHDKDLAAIREELDTIEQELQHAIRTHNDAAAHYNVLVQTYPTKLIAQLAHFGAVAYF